MEGFRIEIFEGNEVVVVVGVLGELLSRVLLIGGLLSVFLSLFLLLILGYSHFAATFRSLLPFYILPFAYDAFFHLLFPLPGPLSRGFLLCFVWLRVLQNPVDYPVVVHYVVDLVTL